MRRLAALLVVLACTASAQVAPRPLGPAPEGFALAGDSVLALRTTQRTLTVDAVGGGRSFRYDAPAGTRVGGRMAASAQWAALTITLGDDRSDLASTQIVGGPP